MSGLLLAIDQGTSNTKAVLVNQSGSVVARATQALTRGYPQPGWVEQDPQAILVSVYAVLDAVLAQAGHPRVDAIAISNQRESVLLWERCSGTPLGPCVSWQCRRSERLCAEIRHAGAEPLILSATGLPLDPMFSAGKARWLLDHAPDGKARAAQGELCLGTVDSWLLWNLTGGRIHACDVGNAARTQLFNTRDLRWDRALLDVFGVPGAALPDVKPSGSVFGTNLPVASLPGGIPIAAMMGDSHAALFGQGGFHPGVIKATYGTGSSLMTPTSRRVEAGRGIASTIAWARRDVTYALEGNITVSGAAVRWLGKLFNLERAPEEVTALARQVPDSDGVYLVPAFAGLGAPHWNTAARGLICGLTDRTTVAHLARATLDAITFLVRDVFEAMGACSGEAFTALLADGGPSGNDMLMQLQSDALNVPVVRTASSDLSAIGAAYMAGLTVGYWPSEDAVLSLIGPRARFEPAMDDARRKSLYSGWLDALARTTLEPGSRPAPRSTTGARGDNRQG